jgi:hypothetical protein
MLRRRFIPSCVGLFALAGCAASPVEPVAVDVYTPPHVAARRAEWDPAAARYVNTAVRHPPLYFPSAAQDTQKVGRGRPRFVDLGREWTLGVADPIQWGVNVALLPLRVVVHPYWAHRLDYGPLDPAKPAPPGDVVERPDAPRVDQ